MGFNGGNPTLSPMLTTAGPITNGTVCAAKEPPKSDQPNTALLSTILMFGTYLLANQLKVFKNSHYLGKNVSITWLWRITCFEVSWVFEVSHAFEVARAFESTRTFELARRALELPRALEVSLAFKVSHVFVLGRAFEVSRALEVSRAFVHASTNAFFFE